MRFLHKFMGTGTVLFVSHDTGAVANLCGKAVLLNHGQVTEIGTPKNVIEHYLASVYELNQDVCGVLASERKVPTAQIESPIEYRDMRDDLISASKLRNDIQIYQFNPDLAGFGTGDATILSVRLVDTVGAHLSWVVGGEDVVLEIRCLAHKDILRPIVGFHLKDRLGQIIFCDNTYLAFQHKPVSVCTGATLITRFEFRLPILPTGDYTISPAIAEGTQDQHIQHHWLHDALILKVHASFVVMGLVGLPIKKISMESE
jgi:lipopolysaccharide transport system ATP-binding protein